MNKSFIKSFALCVLALSAFSVKAQVKNINSAEYNLENGNVEELLQAKIDIDNAAVNEKTKTSSRMFMVRGKVYSRVYEKKNNDLIKPVSFRAGYEAGLSFANFYASNDKDKKGLMEDAENELRSGFVSVFYESQSYGEKLNKLKDSDPLSHKLADTLVDYYKLMLSLYDKLDTATSNEFAKQKVKRNFFVDMVAYYASKNSDELKRIQILTELIEKEVPSGIAVESVSNYYVAQNQNDKAREIIKVALAKSNNSMEIFNILVNFYITTKQESLLFDDINAQIKNDPSVARNFWIRGYLYESQKEYEKAIADYTEAKKLDEFYYDAYWNLGAALIKYRMKTLREDRDKSTSPDAKREVENRMMRTYEEARKNFEFAAENEKYKKDELIQISKGLRTCCLELKDMACANAQRDRQRFLEGYQLTIGTRFTYKVEVTDPNATYELQYLNKQNTLSSIPMQKGNWEKDFDVIDKTDMLSVQAKLTGKTTGKIKVSILINGMEVRVSDEVGAGIPVYTNF